MPEAARDTVYLVPYRHTDIGHSPRPSFGTGSDAFIKQLVGLYAHDADRDEGDYFH